MTPGLRIHLMKKTLLILVTLMAVAACSGESPFPEPTGKGRVRVINAIPTAPVFTARIEERSLGQVDYKASTTPALWDDFEYNFNFETITTGNRSPSRVATRTLKVEANTDYTFVLTGDTASPTVSVLEKPFRTFAETDTVSELRLGHFAAGFPAVDVFINPEGVVPAIGEQRATLAFGETSDPLDIEEGQYVVSITAAGDPSTVVFESDVVTFGPRLSLLVAAFAPTANDTNPLAVLGFGATSSSIIADVSSPPTVRFVHGAFDLGNIDIYRDDELTELYVADLAFEQATGDIDVSPGSINIDATPAGSTASVVLDRTSTATTNTRSTIFVQGSAGSYVTSSYIPDLRSIDSYAKLRIFNSGLNTAFVDLYLVPAGTTVEEDTIPRAAGIGSGTPSNVIAVSESGSYDVYVTAFGSKTPIAGPVTVDAEPGDVFELALFDTADPNVGSLRLITEL